MKMRGISAFVAWLVFCSAMVSQDSRGTPAKARAQKNVPTMKSVQTAIARLPLAFEPNQGQAAATDSYVARGPGYSIALSPGQVRIALSPPAAAADQRPVRSNDESRADRLDVRRPSASIQGIPEVSVSIVGADPHARSRLEEPLSSHTNYYKGKDRSRWLKGVPNYGRVRFEHVLPGVDLAYYGNQGRLEYDLILHPGARPQDLRLKLEGAESSSLEADGSLKLSTSAGDIRFLPPTVYQEKAGRRQAVEAAFLQRNNGEIGFRVGDYDKTRKLVVDPVLVYSTRFGSSSDDKLAALALDPLGDPIIVTSVCGAGIQFPTTPGALRTTRGSDCDVVISFFDPTLTTLQFSTYFGGTGDDTVDGSNNVVVDGSGDVYVTGDTTSPDFPVVNGRQAPAFPFAGQGFLTKFGSVCQCIFYSTFLGGTIGDNFADPLALALDANGNAIVFGETGDPNFLLLNAFSGPVHTGYLSVDSGATWSDSSSGLHTLDIRDMAVPSTSPNTVYAAASGGGFSRSLDGGATWTNQLLPGLPQSISIAVDPTDSQVVYAGTFFQGVFKSIDGGNTWTQSNNGLGSQITNFSPNQSGAVVFSIAIDPTNRNTIYLGTFLGVYKSTDGGANWFAMNNGFNVVAGPTSAGFRVFQLAIDPTSPNTIYAAVQTANPNTNRGIWKSTDGGNNWAITALNNRVGNVVSRTQNLRCVTIDPANPAVLYACSGAGIWRSLDAGTSWAKVNNGFTTGTLIPLPHRIVIDPTNSAKIYVATKGYGVFRSTDGAASWFSANAGQPNLDIRTLAVFPNATNRLLLGSTNFDGFVVAVDANGNTIQSSLMGGNSFVLPQSAGADGSGSVYVSGETLSTNLGTPGAFQSAPAFFANSGPDNAFTMKIAAGGPPQWFSYLGGSAGTFFSAALGNFVESSGSVWLTGVTGATNFPVTAGAYQSTGNVNFEGDAFISELSSDGSTLLYSSYFGSPTDDDEGRAILIDGNGVLHVAGISVSPDLPVTSDAFQPAKGGGNNSPTQDAFHAAFTDGPSFLGFLSYLGGAGNEEILGLKADQNNDVYVLGWTDSTDFPTLAGAFRTSGQGGADLFLAKVGSAPILMRPQVLTFPDTYLGVDSAAVPVTVTNNTANPVSIRGIFLYLDFKQSNDCGQVLAAFSSCTINITFRPIGNGLRRAALYLYTDVRPSPFQVSVSGNALSGPVLTMSPTALNFPNTLVGSTSNPQLVRLSNTGSAPFNITSITSPQPSFLITTNCPVTLARRASCSATVRFAPQNAQSYNSTLNIADTAPGNPHSVSLAGTGLAGRPRVSLSQTSISYGSVVLGFSAGPVQVVLTNTGSGNLTFSQIRLLGDYQQTNDCPGSLAPNTSCNFFLTFSPRFNGTRKGVLQILTNAPSSPNYVKLDGTGFIPQ